jgi:HKD family nuclease
MRTTFIHQPFPPSISLGDWLRQHLEQEHWTHFDAAIAFVKRSGVRYIHPALLAFSRRASVKIFVGVDLRGTSQEGLEDLLACVPAPNQVWVCRNEKRSTFHPKVYLFRSQDSADIVIGSGNLTEGGLFTNYEASLALSLDLREPAEKDLVSDIDRTLDDWSNPDTGTSKLLTADIIQDLVDRGYIVGESETRGAESTTSDPVAPDQSNPLFASRPVPRPRMNSKVQRPGLSATHYSLRQEAFWKELLPEALRRRVTVLANVRPTKKSYLQAPAGPKGMSYQCSISRHGAFVQLVINKANKDHNKTMFRRLAAKKDEIVHTFGPGLQFERRDDQIGSYVVYELGETWAPYDESSWPQMQDRLIGAVDRLYRATQPHIRELFG